MRIIIKKFAYLFLMMAVAGASAQPLYASPQHQCEHAKSSMEKTMDMDHCQQVKSDSICQCNNCGCKVHASFQLTSSIIPVVFQYHYSLSEVVAELTNQYTHYYFNPLLRPPIS